MSLSFLCLSASAPAQAVFLAGVVAGDCASRRAQLSPLRISGAIPSGQVSSTSADPATVAEQDMGECQPGGMQVTLRSSRWGLPDVA